MDHLSVDRQNHLINIKKGLGRDGLPMTQQYVVAQIKMIQENIAWNLKLLTGEYENSAEPEIKLLALQCSNGIRAESELLQAYLDWRLHH